MSDEIVFERARIVAVEHKISAGSVSSRMKVVAIATAKIARAIGARWLLDKEALVKQGFTSVELDYLMKNVRAKHAIDKVQLELVSDLITKFKVFRKGDDAKKSKRLMVSFVVHHVGSPFELLEHLMKVGEGEGICTLVPLQVEMFDKQPEAKPKKVAPLQLTTEVKVPAEIAAAGPRMPRQANDAGVFAGIRPLARYKGKAKTFWAELYAVEHGDGFLCGYRVKVGHAGREGMPSTDGVIHESQAKALAVAAEVVAEVAGNIERTGIRSHKREAAAMVEWAEKYIASTTPPVDPETETAAVVN